MKVPTSLLAGLALAWLPLTAQAAPSMLHVAGTKLQDDRGRVVRLQGVNVPSLEWTDTGDHVLQSVGVAIDTWHANVIRLPLSQDRWFGKSPTQTDGGAAYRAIVDHVVKAISDKGAYVVLDLHWSDGGQWGQHIGQHSLPDDNSTASGRTSPRTSPTTPPSCSTSTTSRAT